MSLRSAQKKLAELYLKKIVESTAQVIESLLSKGEALGSIPSITLKNKHQTKCFCCAERDMSPTLIYNSIIH
jgi:hypothetical protein